MEWRFIGGNGFFGCDFSLHKYPVRNRIDSVIKRWNSIKLFIKIPKSNFRNVILKFVLSSIRCTKKFCALDLIQPK